METLKFHVVGTTPLMMHNARLANPLDEIAVEIKKLTSMKKKTEETQLAILRLEYEGGLYFDPKIGPYIPGEVIEATIKNAAKLQKRGMDVSRGLIVLEAQIPLKYKGPREIEALYADKRFRDIRSVRIGRARTMRCRPIFNDWELEFSVLFDPEVFNPDNVRTFARDAGRYVGFCEMRPRFGKFELVGGNGKN